MKRLTVAAALAALTACGQGGPSQGSGSVPFGTFTVQGSVPNPYGVETLSGSQSGVWSIVQAGGGAVVQLSGLVQLVSTLGATSSRSSNTCALSALVDDQQRLSEGSMYCYFALGACSYLLEAKHAQGYVAPTGQLSLGGAGTVTLGGCTGQPGTFSFSLTGQRQ